MFDFSVSPQTGLSIMIIILLVWVLLSVQGLGDRVLSLETAIHTSFPKMNTPITSASNKTPVVDLNEIPPQVFEPFNQSNSGYRLLSAPVSQSPYGNYDSHQASGLQFNFEGKGWTGMAMPRNSQFAEFM